MAAEIHRLRDRAARRKRVRSTLVMSTSATSISWCRKASIPTVPTSFGPLSATGLRPMPRKSRNRLCGIRWSSVFATLPARIWRRSRAAGEKLHIKVLGLTSIAPDVSPELALATIESITVLGALHATKEIKSALADRIR